MADLTNVDILWCKAHERMLQSQIAVIIIKAIAIKITILANIGYIKWIKYASLGHVVLELLKKTII